MQTKQLIAITLPYLFLVFLQFVSGSISAFAKKGVENIIPEDVKVDSDIKDLCIGTAQYTFTHLQFIFGVVMATVSSIAYTLTSKYPELLVIASIIFVGVMLYWLLKWKDLTPRQLNESKGKSMNIVGWVTIVLQYALALIPQF